MKHFDYIPELDGPQSFVAAGGRTILCKGGGGGSSSPYYGNMDRLYGVQSQAAEYMLSNSMPYIPGYMENSNKMVTESMDGTLANQMRQRAGNESTATMGAALAASDRNMQRYGMGFSADRLLTESNRNAIMGAAGKAGSMNDAAARAEDMKWNRNAGALGQATGMGMGSMESVGSAARGYGAAAGQVGQYDAMNAAGYGKFGAAVASNAFKDGGKVKTAKPGLHLAAGGPSANPWASWKNNNPIQTSEPNNGGGSGLGDAVGSIAMGAAPIVVGKGLKAGLSAVKGAMAPTAPAAVAPTATTGSGLTTGTASVETGGAMANGTEGVAAAKGAADTTAATTAGTDAAVAAGTDAAGTAAADAGTAALADAGATVATDAAATAAADAAATAGTTALAETAGTAAAGELATAAGTSATMGPVGWVAAGALALGALGMSQGWFADGGNVRRKDFTPGGDVSGPGTATSDDIPAWLSDGEHVQNATAVELAGLDTLEKINNAGLNVRQGKQSTETAKAKIGKAMIERGKELTGGLELAKGGKVGCKMASGGNVGIALGAAADEWNKQRVLGMEQSLTDLQLKKARAQLELQDDQIAAGRSLYKYQDAANKAGLETLPQQTANTQKQQQLTGIGLDDAITGRAGQKMGYGNKEGAIKILNQAAAAQPGFDGTTVLDITPQKNGAGVFLHLSDKSVKPVSREEIIGAMGTIKQGDYQSVHDGAGNFYSFNKSTGKHEQQVKGDPNNLPGKAKPADVASAEWLISNGVAKDAKSAWDLVRSSREKTRSDFVLDYVSKNAMPGSDITQSSKQAGDLYDSLRKNQSGAATSDVPAGSQTGTGKSGVNWQEWMKPPQ